MCVVLEEEAVAAISKREIINAFLCMYKHSVYKLKNYSHKLHKIIKQRTISLHQQKQQNPRLNVDLIEFVSGACIS